MQCFVYWTDGGLLVILFLTRTCNALLDFFVRQDLDRIFGEDVAQAGPNGGCCDKVSAIIST